MFHQRLNVDEWLAARLESRLDGQTTQKLKAIKELLQKFEFDRRFGGLSSLKQQMNALQTDYGYIEPVEIPLGQRMDSETGTNVPKVFQEVFQYRPIVDVLSLLLSNRDVKKAQLSEEPSKEGGTASFTDGQMLKKNPFFQKYPQALKLEIFYDELEVVNPLGSKTGHHKLGVVLAKVGNVPEQINSCLGNIHVISLCRSADVKKYGLRRILQPFISDLEKLESDDGVVITLQDEVCTLRASIVQK